MLKSTYRKSEPEILRKRKYTNFWEEPFRRGFKIGFKNDGNFSNINDNLAETLDNQAPVKITKFWQYEATY